MWDQLATAT